MQKRKTGIVQHFLYACMHAGRLQKCKVQVMRFAACQLTYVSTYLHIFTIYVHLCYLRALVSEQTKCCLLLLAVRVRSVNTSAAAALHHLLYDLIALLLTFKWICFSIDINHSIGNWQIAVVASGHFFLNHWATVYPLPL